MNRFISWHRLPSPSALVLMVSVLMEMACNSTTEFVAIEKKDFSTNRDLNPENFQRSFAAAEMRHSSVKWEPEDNTLVEYVTLQKDPAIQLRSNQIERPLREFEATQGYDGRENTQQFSLWQAGLLDILIVMDNSGTMQSYQEKVAQRLEPLLENIKNTNWRIAVVSTDSPCVKGVISRSDYDADKNAAELAFKSAVRIGTQGSNVERGIEMAIKGFAPETYCASNAIKWTRESAKTAVIMVSDEANCGSASNEGCGPGTPYTYFGPNEFRAMTPSNTRFFGLLHEESNPLCSETAGYDKQPDEYYDLASITGGLWRPICQMDYAEVLGEISRNVGSTLTREFELAATPTQGSLKVYLDNQEIRDGYSLTANKVTLVGNASQAVNVQFQYSHGAVERFNSLRLSGEFDPSSVKVVVNDVKVGDTAFQVDQGQGVLSFIQRPPDYAKVRVTYREPGELKKEFSAPAEVMMESIEVRIDDKVTKDFEYDAELGKVTFVNPPEDGALISVTGRRLSDYTLEYPLRSGDMAGLARIGVRSSASGEEMNGIVEDGVLTLAADIVENNSQVAVVFELTPDPESFYITLPEEPVVESMVLTGPNEARKCLENAPREGRTIKASCLIGQKEPIAVDFDYVIRRINEFTVDLPSGIKIAEWTVRVDGNVVPFTREGLTFKVDSKHLKDTSRVTIDGRPK